MDRLGLTLRVGLTGGIGSGKSTVAASLVRLGATLVDTDAISRSLTATGGAALPAIAEAFGAQAIGTDGALDRAHMRELAFSVPDARRRLEAILHPLIGAAALCQAETAPGAVVFDIPLLTESSPWRSRVHKILVVDCPEATQIERVMQRSGWPRETVQNVISQQASRAARRGIADAVIFNDGLTLEQLDAHVRALWSRWAAPL
jgi:dephospho-CoA kinase